MSIRPGLWPLYNPWRGPRLLVLAVILAVAPCTAGAQQADPRQPPAAMEPCQLTPLDGSSVLAAALAFLAVLFLFRWQMIATPTARIYRAMVASELADVDRLRMTSGQQACHRDLFERQRIRLEGLLRADAFSIGELLFWNRGSELSGMILLHGLRRQRTLLLTKKEEINAQLQTCKARLGEITDNKIASDFSARINAPAANSTLEAQKMLLADASSFLDDQADSAFSVMAGWHNKTFWLIVCALLLILGLCYTIGNERLFLLGAAGGLLSRLTYSLYRPNVPTDYGASWSKIFLSPVVGALTGWAGGMLLQWANSAGLTGALLAPNWCKPGIAVYGVTLLLGFSERLFTRILAQLEEETSKKIPVEQSK